MKTVMMLTLTAIATSGLWAQAPERIVEPLGETTEANMTLFVLDLAPGGSLPARTHTFAAFAHVIEGEVESRRATKAPETLPTGSYFRENRGEPSRLLRNVSTTAPAKVLILQNSASLPQGAKPLLKATLPDLKDLEVTIGRVVQAASDPGPRPHHHAGPTFAYLWKGEVKSQVDPDEPETFRAGDFFFESPERIHRSYLTLSKDQPSELLLFGVSKKGQRSAQVK